MIQAIEIFGLFGGERRKFRRSSPRESRDGGELFESRALGIAPQHAFSEKVDGNEHAHQQREERQREFPEKVTPHEFRTSTLRRVRSSDGWDSPDRFRFSHAAGVRKRPRYAA